MIAISSTFRKGRNWLVWEEKHKPMSCLTGKRDGWNRTLGTYSEALQFCLNSTPDQYNLGYCFTDDAPFVGLDLDACRNPKTGDVADWAMQVMANLKSYTVLSNISVSGTGVKLILRAESKLKRGVNYIDAEGYGDHEPQIELFCDSKYFALTDFSMAQVNESAETVDTDALSAAMGYDVTEVAVEAKGASGGDTSPEDLRIMLSKLDIMEFQSRSEWLKIMQASHHATGGSLEGKKAFKEWSAGDEANYSESDIERDWNSLKPHAKNPVTVGTIIAKIAPEDRPRIKVEDEFSKLKRPVSHVLTWLVDEEARNHGKLVEQFVAETTTLRYVSEWGRWIAYSNGVWVLDDHGHFKHVEVLKFIKTIRGRIPECSDPDLRAKIGQWVCKLGDWNNTNAVMRQLDGHPALTVSSKELGANINLLNLKNGTYDLRTNKFRGHDPNDYCMQQCDVDYSEGQVAEKWVAAVDQIFGGDKELVNYVRRLLGKCLSGADTDPKFNIFYGDGCNGKSTLVQTVGDILGSYSVSLPSEMFDNRKQLHPQYLAKLFRARLAIFAEMDSDVPLAEGTVKKITSVDAIEARRMYEKSWSFTPTHTPIICTNHKPRVKGGDTGLWRRLQLVPFEVDLTECKDIHLMEKLKKERSGILNWLIEGNREFLENGAGSCEAVTEATEEYRELEDDVTTEFFEIFEKVANAKPVATSDAHSHYAMHGGRFGRKSFVTHMKRVGFDYRKVQVDGRRNYYFTNLKFREEFGAL